MWEYRNGVLTPSLQELLQRNRALMTEAAAEPDSVVTFCFPGAADADALVHKSRLLLAGGPLARLASGTAFVEHRTNTVALSDDDPEAFAIVRQFLYLDQISLVCCSPNLVINLCEAANRWCLGELLRLALKRLSFVLTTAETDVLELASPIFSTVPAVPVALRLTYARRVAEKFKAIVVDFKAYEREQGLLLEHGSDASDVSDSQDETHTVAKPGAVARQCRATKIWQAFTTFPMRRHMVEHVTNSGDLIRDDAHDLVDAVVTHFSNEPDATLLLLLHCCPWNLASIDQLLSQERPAWSPRAVRLVARAACAAERFRQQGVVLRVVCPIEKWQKGRAIRVISSQKVCRGYVLSLELVEKAGTRGRETTIGARVHLVEHDLPESYNLRDADEIATNAYVRLSATGCFCGNENAFPKPRSHTTTLEGDKSRSWSEFISADALRAWSRTHAKECYMEVVAEVTMC